LSSKNENWLYTISPKKKVIDLNLKEIWQYRDLLILFVKRNVITVYKQTILGPLWFLIQPLFTSIIFTLVFNNLGQIKTGDVPPFLFNMAGITAWNYFKECLNGTSNTFVKNQGIFGKVYFPRVIMPLTVVISNLLKFGIQLGIFVCFFIYFYLNGSNIQVNYTLALLPVYVLIMALLGLGFGMIFSSLTTKYRDLTVLIGFGVSLLMYLSAVPYPLSEAKNKFPNYVTVFVEYNPLTQVIEGFRYSLLNIGMFSWNKLIYTLIFGILIVLVGLILFNRTEKKFIDTV
jgi:lipopolysaccharide transport system permease protein